MYFAQVKEENIAQAGRIHSESWQESHRSFCAPEFVERHTPQAQTDYLHREIAAGKRVFLLIDAYPVGIVSVWGSLIENLYVLPQDQGKGYGTLLLKFAMEQCLDSPTLWILDNNEGAYRLYARHGFQKTGVRKQLREDLYEIEMVYSRLEAIRQAEAESHTKAYTGHELFAAGSWLEKPVKTVLELLPVFDGYPEFCALDLGSGVGRNSIPVAQHFTGIPCRVDCVDILELAIDKLRENALRYGVADAICGMAASIDSYEIKACSYDLIMAVSALEHVASKEAFVKKLTQIRDGLRKGGAACLIVNTSVQEHSRTTGKALPPQFEVNLQTGELRALMAQTFPGWQLLKHSVVHQKYDIPRGGELAELETDVVTYVVRKG